MAISYFKPPPISLPTLLANRELASSTPFAGQQDAQIVHDLVTGGQSFSLAQKAAFDHQRCREAAKYLSVIEAGLSDTEQKQVQESLIFYRDRLQALGQEPKPQSRAAYVRHALGIERQGTDFISKRYRGLSRKAKASLYLLLADESEKIDPAVLRDILANDSIFNDHGKLLERPLELFSLFISGYGFDVTESLLCRDEEPIVSVLSRWEHALDLALHSDVTEIELNKSFDVDWALLLPKEVAYINRHVLPRLSETAREYHREQYREQHRVHLYAANATDRWLTAIIHNPEGTDLHDNEKAKTWLQVYRYVLAARAQNAALEFIIISDKSNTQWINTLRKILERSGLSYSLRTRGKKQLTYGQFQYAINKGEKARLSGRRALPAIPDYEKTDHTPSPTRRSVELTTESVPALEPADFGIIREIYSSLRFYLGAGTLHYDPQELSPIEVALRGYLQANLGWTEEDVAAGLANLREQALRDMGEITPLEIPEGFEWSEEVGELRDPFTQETLNAPELVAKLWQDQRPHELWSFVRAVPTEAGDNRYLVHPLNLLQRLRAEGLKDRIKHPAEETLAATVLGSEVPLLGLHQLTDYLFRNRDFLERFIKIQKGLASGFDLDADTLVLSGTLLHTLGSEPHVQELRVYDTPVTASDNQFQLRFSRDGENHRLNKIRGTRAMELGAAWFAGQIERDKEISDTLSLALLATIWNADMAISNSDAEKQLQQLGILDRWNLVRQAAPKERYPDARPPHLYLVGQSRRLSETSSLYSRLSFASRHDETDVPQETLYRFVLKGDQYIQVESGDSSGRTTKSS